MIFPPPNLTVFWVNLGSIRAPVGLLQYLRWLWCNSTEDSSEKSTFCHFSSVHPFGRLWALAKATRFFNCLLFSAGFWALFRPWRPFQDRIWQTVLVDTGTLGDQVSWSSAAVEKGLALDFRANKRSSRVVVLRGLPDLQKWTQWALPSCERYCEYFSTVSFCTKTLFQKLLGLKWAISCKKILIRNIFEGHFRSICTQATRICQGLYT